jgi:gluconate 2-dehydrogenase gamma chain
MNCSVINVDNILGTKKETVAPYKTGISRREFLKLSASAGLLAGFLESKPVFAKPASSETVFSEHQNKTMLSVQQVLFPDDGDGPSASDLNALKYLHWALEDPNNIADGDPAYLIKGLVSIDVFTEDLFGKKFIELTEKQQNDSLVKIEKSSFGENWLSLIIYYLMEALLLDPAYGGNPNGIGWQWLEHQPGFPRPNKSNTYLNYGVIGES